MLSLLGAVGLTFGVMGGLAGISYGIYAGTTALKKALNW